MLRMCACRVFSRVLTVMRVHTLISGHVTEQWSNQLIQIHKALSSQRWQTDDVGLKKRFLKTF